MKVEGKHVPADKIVLGPNVRQTFNEEGLKDLAELIRVHGLLNPLGVEPVREGRKVAYKLIDGFRRYHAIQLLIKDKALKPNEPIPVSIRGGDELVLAFINIAENSAREDVHVWETAQRFAQIKEAHGLSQAEMAERSGLHRTYVSKALGAHTKAIPEIREYLDKGNYRTDSRVNTKWVLRVCNWPEEKQALAWKELQWQEGSEGEATGNGDKGSKGSGAKGESQPEALSVPPPSSLPEMADLLTLLKQKMSRTKNKDRKAELKRAHETVEFLVSESQADALSGQVLRWILHWGTSPAEVIPNRRKGGSTRKAKSNSKSKAKSK